MDKQKTLDALWEGMKGVNSLDRLRLPLLAVRSIFVVCLTYLYSILTSAVVDRLAAGAPWGEILMVTGVGLSLIFAVTALSHLLNRMEKVRNARCLRLYSMRKSEGLMTMDFADLDSSETREKLAKMHTEEAVGFGLPSLLLYLGELAQLLISVAMSVFLLVLLLGGENGGMRFLWTGIFVAASVAVTLCSASMTKRANDASLAAIRNTFPPNIIINDFLHNEHGIRYQDGKDIRIYKYQQQIDNIYEAALGEMRSFDKVGGSIPALAAGFGGAIQGITMCASYLFVFLVWRIRLENLGWALLLASVLYQMTAAIAGTAEILSKCTTTADSVNRYMRFLSENASPDCPAAECGTDGHSKAKESVGTDGTLEVRNLSFCYPGTDREALRHVSLELPKGNRIALVGANGSGKTTLVKLLCGLYRPQSGTICWNGADVSNMPLEDYMSLFSVVFQDFQLFSLPLGETVAVSDSYEEGRVIDALRRVGVDCFRVGDADVLGTYLFKDFEDGIELSNGEAQKVALARALYRDTPILILDEPTAALDPIAEAEIYQHINEINRDTTVLFISHRLSACRFCDQIIVMDDGKIVQRGTHESLLAEQDGLYHKMWTAQAQYYTKAE